MTRRVAGDEQDGVGVRRTRRCLGKLDKKCEDEVDKSGLDED